LGIFLVTMEKPTFRREVGNGRNLSPQKMWPNVGCYENLLVSFQIIWDLLPFIFKGSCYGNTIRNQPWLPFDVTYRIQGHIFDRWLCQQPHVWLEAGLTAWAQNLCNSTGPMRHHTWMNALLFYLEICTFILQ
jgi:hypothetical protein